MFGASLLAAQQADRASSYSSARRPYDCDVPFTHRNLKADLEDVGANFDGAPDLEFRVATKALELEDPA